MERKKKPQPQENKDELALVNAAAWAWYQHGSKSEAKMAMNEFDVKRTKCSSRPSHYKLGAMRMTEVTNNNSLLDTYEVQCISRQLDSLLESSNKKHVDDTCNFAKTDNGNGRVDNKKRFFKFREFWAKNVVACGGGDDVVGVKFICT
ncbi:hypothetical protein TSUD_123060 [Trifolium subterraneum]|uniref:Uncharacterized protein n=1 Tax=Trifolium subterraneum TaxID=3900 RepID=A0A2Z6MU24_TRISU|nr:hypothetical protein TSUD_123060 [Trifolium subterraneum]